MQEHKLYLCDPDKNPNCRKTICYLNPAARDPYCYGTKFPECALTRQDGSMIVLPTLKERLTARGVIMSVTNQETQRHSEGR